MSEKPSRSDFLRGRKIEPSPVAGDAGVADLVDSAFLSFNAGRLREICQLFTTRILDDDVTIGMSLTGALTPAGLGMSCLIPLVRAGFVDWIISTGANLYHDTHFGLGFSFHRGTPNADDVVLRGAGVVRIYDIFFDYEVLLDTDAFFRKVIEAPEFQREMGTAEFHYLVGGYVREREKALGLSDKSLLAVAHEHALPIFTSSPGDSSIGMNVAAMALRGNKLRIDVNADVNDSAAIVLAAKRAGGAGGGPGRSAAVIFGGGSPKNFLLQTEPQLQEVLAIEEKGHDFFVQVTDARVDTGGLSGATPGEAVSWGKIDPDKLPDAVVCYLDTTVAMPILTAYALARRPPRKPRRLVDRLPELRAALAREARVSKE